MLSFINIARASLLVGVAALLSACVSAPPVTPIPAPVLTRFQTVLSPLEEVPPVSSDGRGLLRAELDTRTSRLSWVVSYSGLTGPVTAAHFHGPALPGQNAGIVVPLTGDLTSVITGSAVLTPAQRADLLSGRWYINLHTARYPDGEIRGQVRAR